MNTDRPAAGRGSVVPRLAPPRRYTARVTLPERRQRVHTLIRLRVPLMLTRTRWMFGANVRLLRIWEWLIWCPLTATLPQISHLFANVETSERAFRFCEHRRTGDSQEARVDCSTAVRLRQPRETTVSRVSVVPLDCQAVEGLPAC